MVKEKESQIEYYRKILEAVCSKATCEKLKVGVIIVKNKSIISTGYNGSPRGLPHCIDEGCILKNGHCVRTTHSETNAIITAARHGININGSDMYCLYKPCYNCMKIIINSGIKNAFYFEDYKDDFQYLFEKNKHTKFIKIK